MNPTPFSISLNMESVLPSMGDFMSEAALYPVVPVWMELVADSETPLSLLAKLGDKEPSFLLESAEQSDLVGRYSFVGAGARIVIESRGNKIRTSDRNGLVKSWEAVDPLKELQNLMEAYRCRVHPELPGFTGGAVGYLGYDAVRRFETSVPPAPLDDLDLPEMLFLVADTVVIFDHKRRSIKIVACAFPGELGVEASREEAIERIEKLMAKIASASTLLPFAPKTKTTSLPLTSNMSREAFENAVTASKEYIRAGDIFQIVLSQRFDVGEVEDPFAVYRVLRQMNPSAYLYYLQLPDCTVVGSSPEALVRMRNKRVTTRPIAGSRPVSDSEVENALRAATLREDPKEIAEHVMLVDLGRNDIGRISSYGSVVVEELMQVEYYSHIMHLTSQVSGEVREDVSSVDALRATFPAGTLSGAPKVRAMELIGELEPQSRGLYGGAVGYFDTSGNFDAAILIRTLVVDSEGNGSVQTGAGIVWDSDPRTEDEECLSKAEAVLRAVGGARSAP